MKNKYRNEGFLSPLLARLVTTPFLISSLLIVGFILFYKSLGNYFVGDDFTWLRWSAVCLNGEAGASCRNLLSHISSYFTEAAGFFYRPGTKIYFLAMNQFFSVNHVPYHVVSVLLHTINAAIVFAIGIRLFKTRITAFAAAVIFLILSVHSETVFWISSINHLAASFFALSGILLFIFWRGNKREYLFWLSVASVIISPLFHELGIVAPLLIVGYDVITKPKGFFKLRSRWYDAVYLLQIPLYLFLRYSAHSHWSGGDYSYSISNLPYNIFGNAIGYVGLIFGGQRFLPFYSSLRIVARENIGITIFILGIGVILACSTVFLLWKHTRTIDKKTLGVSLLFFFVPLLPFLALGNIAYRYAYLASIGLIMLVLYLIEEILQLLPKRYSKTAVIVLVCIGAFYAFYNISSLLRTSDDWRFAGSVAKNVQTLAVSGAAEQPATQVFYFINTPIRYKEAWVFPVGLPDAVWLVTQGKDIQVRQVASVADACNVTNRAMHEKIFLFTKEYAISDMTSQCNE